MKFTLQTVAFTVVAIVGVVSSPVKRSYDTCVQVCADASIKLQDICATHRAASARRRCVVSAQNITEHCYSACANCSDAATTTTTWATSTVPLTWTTAAATATVPSTQPVTSTQEAPSSTSEEPTPSPTPTPIGQITTYEVQGCEYDSASLTCAEGETITQGVIQYGRWNNTACAPSSGPDFETAPSSKNYTLPERYLNAQNATIDATAGFNTVVQEDPVPGDVKQYVIQYICQQ